MLVQRGKFGWGGHVRVEDAEPWLSGEEVEATWMPGKQSGWFRQTEKVDGC